MSTPQCRNCHRTVKTRGYCMSCFKVALKDGEVTYLRKSRKVCANPTPTCECRACVLRRLDAAVEERANRSGVVESRWDVRCILCGWNVELGAADAHEYKRRKAICLRCLSSGLVYEPVLPSLGSVRRVSA